MVIYDMNPLIVCYFARVRQLAGQCHRAFFLGWDAADNCEKNKIIKLNVHGIKGYSGIALQFKFAEAYFWRQQAAYFD